MAGVMATSGVGRTFCFEPSPEYAEKIPELIRLNPDLSLSELPFAINREDARMQLEIMPESTKGKLSASSFHGAIRRSRRNQVEVRTVDSLFDSVVTPPLGLMKLGVEGAEIPALAGAETAIKRYRSSFLIEVRSFAPLERCREWFARRSYSGLGIGANKEILTKGGSSVFRRISEPR